MEQLIKSIVSPLVDFPDDIVVSKREEARKVVFHLKVNDADVGKVIGKNGRIAKAVRTIVYSVQSETNKRVYLDIM